MSITPKAGTKATTMIQAVINAKLEEVVVHSGTEFSIVLLYN